MTTATTAKTDYRYDLIPFGIADAADLIAAAKLAAAAKATTTNLG